MITFTESGMNFSYEEQNTFYIEKSELYETNLRNHKVSSVECITVRTQRNYHKVLFIEAKTSAPNPNGPKGIGRIEEFVDVQRQFRHRAFSRPECVPEPEAPERLFCLLRFILWQIDGNGSARSGIFNRFNGKNSHSFRQQPQSDR